MENYSLADIAAATNNNNGGNNCGWGGCGGSDMIAWILIFALFGGGGFGGFGNRGAESVNATSAEVNNGFSFSNIQNKLNEITLGISNLGTNISGAVCSSTYELANKIGDCCCQTQLGIQAVRADMANQFGQTRYDMLSQSNEIQKAIHAEGEATRGLIQQNKIETMQQQIANLQLQNALCGVPKINPYGYGVYPYPPCSPCGWGNNNCGACC